MKRERIPDHQLSDTPKRLVILGPAQSGREDAAMWLGENTSLHYWLPTGLYACTQTGAMLAAQFQELKHQPGGRIFLRDLVRQLNLWPDAEHTKNNYACLRQQSRQQQILSGVRMASELLWLYETGRATDCIWMDASDVIAVRDQTFRIRKEWCAGLFGSRMYVVQRGADLEMFRIELMFLAKEMGIYRPQAMVSGEEEE